MNLIKINKIDEILEKLDISQTDFASGIEVSVSAISKWRKSGEVPNGAAWKIERQYGISSKWLLTGEGEMFKQPVPDTSSAIRVSGGVKVYHLGSAFAGDVISLDDSSMYDNVEEWLIPPLGITADRSTALVSFTINGDSMYPTLQRGDILIRDAPTNRIEDIANNAIYVILVPGYPPRCKRLIVSRDRKSITIICDNPAYRDEFAADGAFSACRARHRLTDISEFI